MPSTTEKLYTPWAHGAGRVSQEEGGSTTHSRNLYHALDFDQSNIGQDYDYDGQGFGRVWATGAGALEYPRNETNWDNLTQEEKGKSEGLLQLVNFITIEYDIDVGNELEHWYVTY